MLEFAALIITYFPRRIKAAGGMKIYFHVFVCCAYIVYTILCDMFT